MVILSNSNGHLSFSFFSDSDFCIFIRADQKKIHKMAMICYWPESIIFLQRWVFQINCKHILQFVLRWDVAFPRTHMMMRVVGFWLVLLLLLLFLLLLLLRVVGGGSGWQLQKSSYFLFCLMIPDVDPSSLQLTPLHYLVFIRLCKATLPATWGCRRCRTIVSIYLQLLPPSSTSGAVSRSWKYQHAISLGKYLH